MAAQEWDWFQREELIGQISDIRVQNLQVERENVQKRTFTRWINLHLEKCDPPLEVTDLFVDIQDGKILMALLEVLSGRSLLHEYKSSSHRIFRLNNIAKALTFLEESNVKLVSIDAAEIADGNPSLVLGLIWNIILFFQIKELTGNLSRSSPSSSLSPGSGGTDSDSSYPPTPTAERNVAIAVKDQRKAIKTLLAWVQRKTRKYGVAVQDFAGSWRSGLAFLAVIKAIDPSLVDMKQALEESPQENLERAFRVAHDALHIPRLLEPEDIMVDVPDEQSIVTYVAQFLERFPELEAEEFMDPDKEVPIESTFVRIRETPPEQESKVLLLTQNGERTYTVNHETSHPPPAKVFVCDRPEGAQGPGPAGLPSSGLSDSSAEFVYQIIDQVLQTGATSEPAPEASVLSIRRDSRRPSLPPTKKTVHFEDGTYKDPSGSQEPFYSPDFHFEGSPRPARELLKQGWRASVEDDTEEGKPEEAASLIPEAASSEVPGTYELVSPVQPPQDSSSFNGALEGPASRGEESPTLLPPGVNTVLANSMEIKVKLQTAEPLGNEDCLEGVPSHAAKFISDVLDFASYSQGEAPSGEHAAGEDGEAASGNCVQEPRVGCDRHEPPTGSGQESPSYSSSLKETPVDRKPATLVCEKAKRKSPRHRSEDEEEASGPPGLAEELSCSSLRTSISLETLGSPSEEGLDFKPSPPLSKISVIPHDLFYFPHYEVPLAAVLEVYSEGTEDVRDKDCLPDLDPGEDAEGSWSRCSFSALGEDLPRASSQELSPDRLITVATPASEAAPPALHENQQPGETKGSEPAESHQSQEFPDSENAANSLEEKVMEESTSSKKKEKRKHVDHVDNSLYRAPGMVQSSDDIGDVDDYAVPSRTSHSDSSIYIRRHSNRSLESDHISFVQLRNAADLDERRNRMLTRKPSSSGEAESLGTQSPQSDSLTQLVQQPDMMYFILFLWLLVYCLLLFPQLDVTRL
ncbi:PREDICTED: calmin isoform X2 [Chinchilla lanigera]|uniref:Calmin n=1 Tax=Chinchilla lanigera TaxID=34839 RepID=A0A8C2VXK7_CHILA|nr:PREDICTED: calmin isoform X2 [Chinchilla lanigera]